MERLLEITVDYIKTRKQFGQPLASFQALQHRVAEMYVARSWRCPWPMWRRPR